MLEGEQRLVLECQPVPLLDPPARPPTLAGPAAIAATGSLTSQPLDGVEDQLVEVLHDVEDTQLVAGSGPDLGQQGRVEVGAVGNHHLGQQARALEAAQEAAHVVLVVVGDQGEGHGEVSQRVGGQKQGLVAQVHLIDAQSAREVLDAPAAVLGPVALPDLPIQAVVDEAVGQFEVEVTGQAAAQGLDAHLVVQQSIEDGLADAVGVGGAGQDPLELGAESLATATAGAILCGGQFKQEDLAVSQAAQRAVMEGLATGEDTTVGAGETVGGAAAALDADGWLKGTHACVAPWGLLCVTQELRRLLFSSTDSLSLSPSLSRLARSVRIPPPISRPKVT